MSGMAPWAATLLLAAFMLPFANGESTDTVRPLAAAAIDIGASTLVAWVPGQEAPDFFRIYGIREGTLLFLSAADADAISASVQGGFPEYAVTGVRDGVESAPAVAFVEASLICITVGSFVPPGVAIDHSCIPQSAIKVSIPRP